MPLINILSSKITDNVLSSNRSLSRITTTTLAEAGTNKTNIIKDTNTSVFNSLLKSTGESGIGLYNPILEMKKFAQTNDPTNALAYERDATSIFTGIETNLTSTLRSAGTSLFDLQKYTKEYIAKGVDSMGSLISRTNPSLTAGSTSVGVNGIPDMARMVDSSITTAAGVGTASLNFSITDVSTTILSKAIREADEALGQTIPDVITPTVNVVGKRVSKGNNATAKDIDEGAAPTAEENSTDVIFQDVSLYVEGVQLMYDGISINQSMGRFPMCSFQVPPNASLLEIIRGYQPKVHIFYNDKNNGGERLLFWGHIVACNYNYSQQQGGANISFECVHKNALLNQVTIEWSAGTGETLSGGSLTDTNPNQAALQINNFNSEYSIALALQGITGVQTDPKDIIRPSTKGVINADSTRLDQRFIKLKDRMKGMPTSIMNLWNQIKKEVYSSEKNNVIFSKMYVPLMEDGIRFFDRLGGHNYLEDQIDASRVPSCSCDGRADVSKHETMLPPAFRVGIISAVQTQMAINNLKNSLGFSGEMTDFNTLFTNFYLGVEYEMLTLSSPAEVPLDPKAIVDPDNAGEWNATEKTVIETIVKPQIPFYYAPLCNVLLPNMFNAVSVSQMDSDIPTRVTVIDTTASSTQNNPGMLGVNYRAPQSIRESIVYGRQALAIDTTAEGGLTLKGSTGSSYNIPGKYEMGRGIVHKKIAMPNWLAHFTKDQDGNRASNSDQQPELKDSKEGKNIMDLHYAWIQRYGYKTEINPETGAVTTARDNSRDNLNPYSQRAGIMAYERLMFNGADYDYSKSVAASRSGSVECIFNPYIIPGYPMDIIDSNINHPSFHAMCASVTHSISSRSINTSVGFIAAVSYAELSNYYTFPVHPWLSTALSMINIQRGTTASFTGNTFLDSIDSAGGTSDDDLSASSRGITPDPEYDSNKGDIKSIQQTIIDNPRAKEAADNFYRSVLGVGAADPGLVYDFQNGGSSPVARLNGTWIQGSHAVDHSPRNGGEGNPNLTGVGNLRLVSRPVEGKKSIEAKFGLKFIDLTPQNYNQSRVMYTHKSTQGRELLEPGASLFLDYEEINSILRSVNTNE